MCCVCDNGVVERQNPFGLTVVTSCPRCDDRPAVTATTDDGVPVPDVCVGEGA